MLELLRPRVAGDVSLIACQQLLPEHAAELARADHVIFVDASITARPGSVACRRLFPGGTGGEATHTLNPHSLIGAARDWFGASPQAILVTVGIGETAAGENLSPAIQQALPQIVDLVTELIGGGSAFSSPASRPPERPA